ncbi:MAG: hypothetical protein ABEI74_00150 [Candidatus Pacearchaeota archaeon]
MTVGGFLFIAFIGFNIAMLVYEIKEGYNGWFVAHLITMFFSIGLIIGVIFYYVELRKKILDGKIGQEVDSVAGEMNSEKTE